jgi:hypothetical protein
MRNLRHEKNFRDHYPDVVQVLEPRGGKSCDSPGTIQLSSTRPAGAARGARRG